MTFPNREELIEKMAEVIWEANTQKGASWRELLALNDADRYLNAKTTIKITRNQAKAALNSLLESLPETYGKDVLENVCRGNEYYLTLKDYKD